MSSDEIQIYDFLKQFSETFVSVTEICKRSGGRKRFSADRDWARGVLRRMEVDGWLESNEYGQFRIKPQEADQKRSAEAARKRSCMDALRTYVLQMDTVDDEQPFSMIVKQVVATEYETQFSGRPSE